MQPRSHRPGQHNPAGTMYGHLLEAEAAQREVARKLEWLAVADPALARTAAVAFFVARRIRRDRQEAAA